MINLLPPDAKEQIKYAKMNRVALRYVRVIATSAVALGVILAGGLYMVDQQTAAVEKRTSDAAANAKTLSKEVLPKAKDASDRLAAIKAVETAQTHFSGLIKDLADVLPAGARIDSMTLTGQDKPVSINFTADTYVSALALRNALVTSPRVAAADIVTISQVKDDYKATVVVGFKPGQAK